MRWSARLTGAPWRAAPTSPPGDPVTVPGPRDPSVIPGLLDPRDIQELYDLRDVLARLPAPVAVTYGPLHQLGYANRAYRELFGERTNGLPACEALPELSALGVLPLMDQAIRSRRPRSVKARCILGLGGNRYYNVSCVPLGGAEGNDTGPPVGVLIFAAEVTDQVQAAARLREAERRQREAAVTLQRSLLPQKLEQPADLRVAATYQPGGADAAVGGDWYDVIGLGGGRTALVIGDVMGRGLRAAAVMGQLRTAVRAYARLDLPPHEIMGLLDSIAMEIDANQIATCTYAVWDPGGATLLYASAGHLPLLLRCPDGTVLRGEEQNGPPLGTGGGTHHSHTLRLLPGTTGVLYTDGLVERRDEDIDQGLDLLARTLSGALGDPEIVCARLLRAMGVTAEHDDDVAVLAFHVPDAPGLDPPLDSDVVEV
ncbi:PP2C family protein-serine/threonine phosphatase [Saccharothrix sp. ST-888]|uniref:PP2C family protein-serine/threonine phosphatase n=1 Tax=Saccharothrix sp. ST-888 TaxID=1427391 RepID=UPI000696EFCE|nr:SpoIIE family protein phosphatase [Saccharothrix sp. ST-888]